MKKKAKKLARSHDNAEASQLGAEAEQMKQSLYQRLRPMLHGTPTTYDHEIVTRVNALQTYFANRWIVVNLTSA